MMEVRKGKYENKEELIADLKKYFLSIGFPEEALIDYWKTTSGDVVDFAVIDPNENLPIAMFVIIYDIPNTIGEYDKERERAINNISEIAKRINENNVPKYIVEKRPNEKDFDIFDVTLGYLNCRYSSNFMDEKYDEIFRYASLKNRAFYKTREKIILEEKEKTFKEMRSICSFLILFVGIILILCLCKGFVLSTEILILVGIIIILSILQFASRIKFLGIEFEMLKIEKQKQKL